MLTDFRLVKAGYGDLEKVQAMAARAYIQALYYEEFCSDYEAAFWEMGK